MPKSRSKRVRRQPAPRAKPAKSPPWVGASFGCFLAAGVLIIIGNYMQLFGDASNARLWYGLGLVAASFVVATNWH